MAGRLSVLVLIGLMSFSCNRTDGKRVRVVVFHAGSLSMPMMKLEEAFEEQFPQYDIQREAAGSRTSARKISDLNRSCDVFLSADEEIITSLLIPDHALWSIPFATNELCLVYRDDIGLDESQSPAEWMDILSQKKIRVGRSDPDSDPCGYRTVQALKLADLTNQTEISREIMIASQQNVRPKSADLIAMLETGALDVAFMYRSVAEQHGLKYIIFPDTINLANPTMAHQYAKVSVDVSGATPNSSVQLKGVPIVYGLTIPSKAAEIEGAEKFISFLLSEEGAALLEENHQSVLRERPVNDYDTIPDSLKPHVQE